MKEMIKNTIVKHPAFGREVRRSDVLEPCGSTSKKNRVLIMLLKLR